MNLLRSFLLLWVFGFAIESFADEIANINTLRPDADGEKVAKELKLKSKHIYRHALKGFAASLDDAQVKKLRKDKRVIAVERDGEIRLYEQTVPTT
jgi:hypothetical protein